MWFGDLVTCKTHEDMWLNEGFASYCSELFTENKYSRQAFENAIKENRDQVLHFSNYKEGEYFPVSGVPHQYTYGEHTYMKGEDVANSLRGFLGDSLFFNGIRNYLQEKKFTACSSEDLRDFLQQYSGQNLTAFFSDWIFKGGFVDATIDSFRVETNMPANIQTKVYFKQKLKGTNTYYSSFPIELTLVDENWNREKITVNVSSQNSSATITSTVFPKVIFINENEKIGLAAIAVTNTIKSNGSKSFQPAQITVNTTNIADSALIRVVHHYTAPDGFKNQKPYRLSPQRYFTIEGILNSNYTGTAAFTYDGRSNGFSGNQYLDHLLINDSEDSLFLFFRKDASMDWEIFPKYSKVMGNTNDKLGSIRIDSLVLGDYVLGMKDYLASTELNPGIDKGDFRIYPNPTGGLFTLELHSIEGNFNKVQIFDILGNLIKEIHQNSSQKNISIDLISEKPGVYFVFLNSKKAKRLIRI
jgi:aminopeptidase N